MYNFYSEILIYLFLIFLEYFEENERFKFLKATKIFNLKEFILNYTIPSKKNLNER